MMYITYFLELRPWDGWFSWIYVPLFHSQNQRVEFLGVDIQM